MIELIVEDGIARLSLVRPEARNAISLAGWGEIEAAVGGAEAQGARLLLLSGSPGGPFCAGADISDFDRFRDDPAARTSFRLALRACLDRLSAVPIPTVALVEGACYGAGAALAMACDLRFAGPDAAFAITPAKLGISYPQEDVHRLVSLVGPGQAARLLFSAQSIDGAEAERIGLVDRFYPEGMEEAVQSFAAAVLLNDRESLAILKRSIALAERGKVTDEDQDRAFDQLLGSDALHERLLAYRSRSRERS
jgi:enoyl-CoA hydratase/carnithine racemase